MIHWIRFGSFEVTSMKLRRTKKQPLVFCVRQLAKLDAQMTLCCCATNSGFSRSKKVENAQNDCVPQSLWSRVELSYGFESFEQLKVLNFRVWKFECSKVNPRKLTSRNSKVERIFSKRVLQTRSHNCRPQLNSNISTKHPQRRPFLIHYWVGRNSSKCFLVHKKKVELENF